MNFNVLCCSSVGMFCLTGEDDENLWLQISQKLQLSGQCAVQSGHTLKSGLVTDFNWDSFALQFWQNLASASFSSSQSGHFFAFGLFSTIGFGTKIRIKN